MGLISLLGIAGIFGVGLLYTYGVKPGEPVFHPSAHRWESMPLVVAIDDFGEPARVAIEIWNERLGCQVFREGSEHVHVIVRSADGEPCGSFDARALKSHERAGTWLCPGHDGWVAEIQISQPGNVWQQAWIVTHELGHALGLDDDRPGEFGVMRPTTPNEDRIIRPSDKDTEALRDLYCAQSGPI